MCLLNCQHSQNCYNKTTINVSSSSNVGGICGLVSFKYSGETFIPGSITLCSNNAPISVSIIGDNVVMVGGIAGESTCYLSTSYNTGQISASGHNNSTYHGGLVGWSFCPVEGESGIPYPYPSAEVKTLITFRTMQPLGLARQKRRGRQPWLLLEQK